MCGSFTANIMFDNLFYSTSIEKPKNIWKGVNLDILFLVILLAVIKKQSLSHFLAFSPSCSSLPSFPSFCPLSLATVFPAGFRQKEPRLLVPLGEGVEEGIRQGRKGKSTFLLLLSPSHIIIITF